MHEEKLDELRRAIDEVDHEILALVAKRLRIVLQVGELKREHSIAVYDPARERRILEQLAADAPAPLEGMAVQRIFERLIDECRGAEQRFVQDDGTMNR